MADNIIYRFPEMGTAATEVDGYAEQYKSAANTLIESVLSAVANWEGESKDKFVSFLQGAVFEHIHNTVPQLVGVVSAQIRMSSDNMNKTDAELANNIPQTLG